LTRCKSSSSRVGLGKSTLGLSTPGAAVFTDAPASMLIYRLK
jgi:hypothetical protein